MQEMKEMQHLVCPKTIPPWHLFRKYLGQKARTFQHPTVIILWPVQTIMHEKTKDE